MEQFGKARNPEGFGTELMRIDHELTKVIDKLQDDDLLIVTGNFGNDPSYPGEKHTREYVPLLVTSPQIKPNISLGGRSFSDIGATILDNYDLENKLLIGNSFLRELFFCISIKEDGKFRFSILFIYINGEIYSK